MFLTPALVVGLPAMGSEYPPEGFVMTFEADMDLARPPKVLDPTEKSRW